LTETVISTINLNNLLWCVLILQWI